MKGLVLLKRWLITIFKIGMAAGLIYWIIESGRFEIGDLQKISSCLVWFVGVGLFSIVILIISKRWQILLQFDGVQITYWSAVRLSFIGIFFNFFMPGGVGGDVIKASYLMRENSNNKWFIGWSILFDRILGLMALILCSGVTGLFFYSKLDESLRSGFFTLSLMIVICFSALVGLVVFVRKDKMDRMLKSHSLAEKALSPPYFFLREPKKIALPFLLSLCSQAISISIGGFLIYYLNVAIPIWLFLLIFPFGFLATVLPISPAGIGVGQAAFSFLFENVAGNGEFGVLFITFFQAIQFIVGLLGGVFFIFYNKPRVQV